MRTEIKIAGFGGQGIVTLSVLIATGINLHTDKASTQMEAYGPQARGGDCWAEVIVDDKEIDYPRVIEADYGILLSQVAFNSFAGVVKPGGLIFIDPVSVKIPENYREDVTVYGLPIQNVALTEFKTPLVANIIMFAAFVSITNIFDKEIARRVVQDHVPRASLELNMKAFDRGIGFVHRQE